MGYNNNRRLHRNYIRKITITLMKKYSSYILFLCLILLALVGCSTAARLKKADKLYENGEYYAASEKYKKLQNKLSSKKQKKLKASVNFKMGECYRNLNNHPRAIRAYNSAIRYKYPDSIMYLNIAKSLLVTQKYKESQKHFETYLKSYPNDYEAQCGLYSAKKAQIQLRNPNRYKVSEAKEFNSKKGSNFCPILIGEESNSIMFSSNRPTKNIRSINPITGVQNNNIYFSKQNKSGKWDDVSPIEGSVNTTADEGAISLTSDGKTMYFTRCEDDFEAAQIWKSERSGGEWSEPVLITLFPDSSISCAHPSISFDGSQLYFVSDAQDGYGQKDIYVSTFAEGKWGIPQNLGSQINTSGNEMFPYIRHDGVLFFSSNGHTGLGGLDIYMAEKDSTGNWTVTNMMAPINSPNDDFGITFSRNNDFGYFSSNRNQKKFIDKLYKFEYPPFVYAIEGHAVDQDGNLLGETIIRLVGDNGDIVKVRTKKDGSYRINLNLNTKYVMMASHKGYLNASHILNTFDLNDSKIFKNDFMLSSISKPVKMDNIFYEFGKWTLTENSEAGLNALVKILNDNPNIVIELSAHTDMVGNERTNLELSQKRAQSVVNYLIKAGIDKERLQPKGYAKSQSVVVSAEIEKKYKFLKEGDVLSPEFIVNLTDEQQEICNQINRRTEFKVIKTTYKLY